MGIYILARAKHQVSFEYGNIVGMLLHHTAFHQITLVRGNKRHGQLVVDPNSTKVFKMRFA